MRLKRIYDWDAPEEEWVEQEEPCPTCNGEGVVGETAQVDCPDCEDGTRTRQIPPVAGVEVQHAGPKQHFSPRIIDGGQAEGWLSIAGNQLVIHGENKTLTYDIKRPPGRWEGEQR